MNSQIVSVKGVDDQDHPSCHATRNFANLGYLSTRLELVITILATIEKLENFNAIFLFPSKIWPLSRDQRQLQWCDGLSLCSLSNPCSPLENSMLSQKPKCTLSTSLKAYASRSKLSCSDDLQKISPICSLQGMRNIRPLQNYNFRQNTREMPLHGRHRVSKEWIEKFPGGLRDCEQ